jgi:simple sugar transport system permease protein
MTAGRGWIALAQVVFATWKPRGLLLGAYLFGGVTVLQFHGQGLGLAIPSEFLSMLPYLATIVVLVAICRNPQTILLNKPMSLGQNFKAD